MFGVKAPLLVVAAACLCFSGASLDEVGPEVAVAPLFAAAAPNVTPHACSPSAATTLRYEKVLKQLSALASGPSTTTTAPV